MNALEQLTLSILFSVARIFSRKPRLPILIYHQVLDDKDPFRRGEPNCDEFEEQMEFVNKYYKTFVLSEAVELLKANKLPKNAICITFDDGYKDNLFNAAEILKKRGLVATFFIATGYLNNGCMWNDMLLDALKNTSINELDLSDKELGVFKFESVSERVNVAKQLIKKLKYHGLTDRTLCVQEIMQRLDVSVITNHMMSKEEVIELASLGMEIGAHTVSHPILADENENAVNKELTESKIFLQDLLNKSIKSFAYPNGRYRQDYNDTVKQQVIDAGYLCAVSTEPGVSFNDDSHFDLKRFTPWDKNQFKFGIRLLRNTYDTKASLRN